MFTNKNVSNTDYLHLYVASIFVAILLPLLIPMSDIQKIVVVGATGMLGRPVTYELIKAGYAVRVLARNPQQAKTLFAEATIISGDLTDTASLVKAFTGQDAIYCNLNVPQQAKPTDWLAEREGLEVIIEAARQTHIKKIGFISSIIMDYQDKNGFHWWVFDIKKEAVKKLKQSGIAYCILYPSTFMENFLYTQKRGKRVLLAGDSLKPMHYVAGEDYGKQVAKAFRMDATTNQEYFIQGPEAYTANEAAKVFVQNYTNEKLSITKAPLAILKFIGSFVQQINYGWHINEALNKYPEKFVSGQTWAELGKPTITLKAFAQKYSY